MTGHEIELAVCDAVIRHEVRGVGLSVDDFTDGYARQIWAAVLDLYAGGGTPSLRAVHAQMLRRGSHLNDYDAIRLMALPLGHLVDLEDLVAIVVGNGHRRSSHLARWAA